MVVLRIVVITSTPTPMQIGVGVFLHSLCQLRRQIGFETGRRFTCGVRRL